MDYLSIKKDNVNTSKESSKIGLFMIAATGLLIYIICILTVINILSIHILYFYILLGGIATAISVICIPFLSPAFRKICLPYIPATNQQVRNIIQALNGRTGSLIDLGSGDGRIVSTYNNFKNINHVN